MGIYIGTNGNCTTHFEGGFSSNQAYLTLGEKYAYQELEEKNEQGIQLVLFMLDFKTYYSKQAWLDGEASLKCEEMMRFAAYEGRIDFKITIIQMLTMTLTDLIRLCLGTAIFTNVSEWTEGETLKLVEDF